MDTGSRSAGRPLLTRAMIHFDTSFLIHALVPGSPVASNNPRDFAVFQAQGLALA